MDFEFDTNRQPGDGHAQAIRATSILRWLLVENSLLRKLSTFLTVRSIFTVHFSSQDYGTAVLILCRAGIRKLEWTETG